MSFATTTSTIVSGQQPKKHHKRLIKSFMFFIIKKKKKLKLNSQLVYFISCNGRADTIEAVHCHNISDDHRALDNGALCV
jgi:hypothetical protein